MYLFYTNEYKRESAHSRELLAASIGELIKLDAYVSVTSEIAALDDHELRIYISDNIEVNKNGKPSIKGIPDYSISHCENTWAIIFSDTPCGLDIQYNREAKLEKIASKFYQKDEAESVARLGLDEFFRIWSRREALIKAAGSTVFSEAPSTMGGSATYQGFKWRIYDVLIDFKDNTPESKLSVTSVQERNLKRPHAAVAVRDDSEFAGAGNIKVHKLEL